MNEKSAKMNSVAQVRLGRPTNQLEEIVRFYCAGLGLDLLLEFEKDQAGYSGAILGIPQTSTHLEFVVHETGFTPIQIKPPTKDHLLVFYLANKSSYDAITTRLGEMGSQPVPADNPHWDLDGVTFEDPDGWRVVLMLERNV
jgi:catechol 2,3-dioxygenase-like lactoylglutathione lyase family enzyme